MRTTLDLPDDLHCIATSLARHNKRSLGQIVAELLRLGLEARAALTNRMAEPQTFYRIDALTGLPVVRSPRSITDEDVKALEDEP
ncbi:antitoxin [Thermomonas carbonis]|uniref:Antitoxin n=1 Tax=Thermomonas carbonis TaxID=1463158 RepID=A0A7G9SSJ5_9GAMM|nr:antitoxin [Thermomonas carbonis]QNN70820.1 antitoxin [Thermomonas carbonis]GHC02646.1 putative antitoxin VapB29 [Thermomonas carbonis]